MTSTASLMTSITTSGRAVKGFGQWQSGGS